LKTATKRCEKLRNIVKPSCSWKPLGPIQASDRKRWQEIDRQERLVIE
jgi:hypothetical protein